MMFVLIGSEEKSDLGKLLLQQLAEEQDVSALQLYRHFLSKTMCLNVSHSNLYEMHDDLLMQFYQHSHPDKKPKYFNFKNGADLSKLEITLQINLVVIRMPSFHYPTTYFKIHDRRIFSSFFEENKSTKLFAVDHNGRHWSLFQWQGKEMFTYTDNEEYFAAKAKMFTKGNCFAATVAELLECPVPPHYHGEGVCSSLLDICQSNMMFGKTIIFASHIRTDMNIRRSRNEKNQLFGKLGFLKANNNDTLSDFSRAAIICVTNSGKIYIPKNEFAKVIRENIRENNKTKQESFPNLSLEKEIAAAAAAESDDDDECCKCKVCRDSKVYNLKNMSNGSEEQKLFTTRMNTIDLLTMLGLDTAENVAAVRKASWYCNSFFDAESCTNEKVIGGEEDIQEIPFHTISDHKLSRKMFATQTPILLGLTCAISMDEGLPPAIFAATTPGTSKLVREFSADVLNRREMATVAKYELLSPIFTKLEVMKSKYFQFMADEGYPVGDAKVVPHECDGKKHANWENRERVRKEVEVAFKKTLPGILEQQLDELARNYLVWSFCGERYDLPLLCGHLTTFFKEEGFSRIGIQRDGNRIRNIKADGIIFLDVTRLLPQGASLKLFRQMTGVSSVDKMIFPFDKLTTDLTFLDCTSLPTLRKDWCSRLAGGEAPSQEAIDEAIKLFEDEGHKTVRSYLAKYLANDCDLLGLATKQLFEQYYKLFPGVEVVDCKKYSISSLTSHAGNSYLFANRMPGQYSVNNNKLYSLLAQSLRGGIVAVMKGMCGKDVDLTEYVNLMKAQREFEKTLPQRSNIPQSPPHAPDAYEALAMAGEQGMAPMSSKQLEARKIVNESVAIQESDGHVCSASDNAVLDSSCCHIRGAWGRRRQLEDYENLANYSLACHGLPDGKPAFFCWANDLNSLYPHAGKLSFIVHKYSCCCCCCTPLYFLFPAYAPPPSAAGHIRGNRKAERRQTDRHSPHTHPHPPPAPVNPPHLKPPNTSPLRQEGGGGGGRR